MNIEIFLPLYIKVFELDFEESVEKNYHSFEYEPEKLIRMFAGLFEAFPTVCQKSKIINIIYMKVSQQKTISAHILKCFLEELLANDIVMDKDSFQGTFPNIAEKIARLEGMFPFYSLNDFQEYCEDLDLSEKGSKQLLNNLISDFKKEVTNLIEELDSLNNEIANPIKNKLKDMISTSNGDNTLLDLAKAIANNDLKDKDINGLKGKFLGELKGMMACKVQGYGELQDLMNDLGIKAIINAKEIDGYNYEILGDNLIITFIEVKNTKNLLINETNLNQSRISKILEQKQLLATRWKSIQEQFKPFVFNDVKINEIKLKEVLVINKGSSVKSINTLSSFNELKSPIFETKDLWLYNKDLLIKEMRSSLKRVKKEDRGLNYDFANKYINEFNLFVKDYHEDKEKILNAFKSSVSRVIQSNLTTDERSFLLSVYIRPILSKVFQVKV